jgi:hypothetical protein
MGTLGTREKRGSDGWGSSVRVISWLCLYLYALVAKQMDAGASMSSTAPALAEERSRTNRYRMKQDAHLTRLCRCLAIPLALLTYWTVTANTGSIHHTPSAIGFPTSLMGNKLLIGRTA